MRYVSPSDEVMSSPTTSRSAAVADVLQPRIYLERKLYGDLLRHSITDHIVLDEKVLALLDPADVIFLDIATDSLGTVLEVCVCIGVNDKWRFVFKSGMMDISVLSNFIASHRGKLFFSQEGSWSTDELARLYPDLPLFFTKTSASLCPQRYGDTYGNPCFPHRGRKAVHCPRYRVIRLVNQFVNCKM